MTAQEVSTILRNEGFPYCWLDSIAVAVRLGQIEHPPFNEAGQLVFDHHHVDQLREVFRKGQHRR
jgi:hypothetical protein